LRNHYLKCLRELFNTDETVFPSSNPSARSWNWHPR